MELDMADLFWLPSSTALSAFSTCTYLFTSACPTSSEKFVCYTGSVAFCLSCASL